MLNSIIFAVTVFTVSALPSKEIIPPNLSIRSWQPQGRIINGADAAEQQFPHQVDLIVKDKHSNRFPCGGSLLSHTYVLTAAHCLEEIREADVLLGATTMFQPEITHTVTADNFIVHEGYDSDTSEHDICLIRIPFTNYTNRIQPVKLPAMNAAYADYCGEKVIVAGWGDTARSVARPSILQWGFMTIISNEACDRHFMIHSSNICTAMVDGVNTCNGDSGGPVLLASSNTQIAIISYGYKNCFDDMPAVCTRLTSYLSWLKEISGVFS